MRDNYLQRPLLADLTYIEIPTLLAILSPTKTFIYVNPYKKLNKTELLDLAKKVKQIAKLSKADGIYLDAYKNISKRIVENWAEYLILYAKEAEEYARIENVYKRIKARGIHIGYETDDVVYNEALTIITRRQIILNRSDTVFSEMYDIYYALRGLVIAYGPEYLGC